VWSLDLEHQSTTVTSSPVVIVPPVIIGIAPSQD